MSIISISASLLRPNIKSLKVTLAHIFARFQNPVKYNLASDIFSNRDILSLVK